MRDIFVSFLSFSLDEISVGVTLFRMRNDYVRTTATAIDANKAFSTYVHAEYGQVFPYMNRIERWRTKNNLYRFWATHVKCSDKSIKSFFLLIWNLLFGASLAFVHGRRQSILPIKGTKILSKPACSCE